MLGYSELKNSLFSAENDEISEEIKDEANVKYSSRSIPGKARYMKADQFNKICKDYFIANLQGEKKLTNPENNINIHGAKNTFYVDLDFIMNTDDDKKQEKINSRMLNAYLDGFDDALKQVGIKSDDYYCFPFIANTFTKITNENGNESYKGGSHSMIITKTNFSKDDRTKIYNDVITFVVNNLEKYKLPLKLIAGYKDGINLRDFMSSILDEQPIKSMNLLMPFAQKEAKGRQYKIYKSRLTYKNYNWFILDSQHNNIDEVVDNDKITIEDIENDGVENELLPKASDVLHKEARKIYEFVDSFKYLSKEHKIWDILYGDHYKYYTWFIGPYYRLLVMLQLFSSTTHKDFKRYYDTIKEKSEKVDTFDIIGRLVAKQMAQLCSYRDVVPQFKNRPIYSEQFKNINIMVVKPFRDELTTSTLFEKFINNNFNSDEVVNIEKFGSFIKLYFFLKKYGFNLRSKDLMIDIEDNRGYLMLITNMWNKFGSICRSIVNNFIICIIYEFKNNITDEIEPFDKTKSWKHPICYKNEQTAFKEQLTFYDVDPTFAIGCDFNNEKTRDSTYTDTIKLWITVLLTFMLYDVEFQLQEAIKHTLGPFIKKYIVIVPTQTAGTNRRGSAERILIYNIKQTIELEKYPYNQWLKDEKNMIQKWLNKLYDNYIAKALSTTEKDKGVKLLIDCLVNNKVVNNIMAPKVIKPLAHADKDISEMQKNIISFHNTESCVIPESILIETSNIFPMRNGWLYFDKDGKTNFITNTRAKFLGSGTNVPWVGDEKMYQKYISINPKAKKAFEDVSTMIEQIYPVKEELDYNMKLFASVLYGIGSKDVLHIMYGTGSDGKTTIINALFGMLDAQGFTADVHAEENGRTIEVLSIQGLAETMNADTLLVNNKPGSHDEGGRANIAHMRLVSVQEPNQHLNDGNLNGSVIKELTSGGAISARKIYGEAESVQANALITFQTNSIPGTDDTSKGFRRRISMYTHRSKFVQEYDFDKSNIKYKYLARPALGEAIKHDLYYKQAMFYYLLPYARDNLRNHKLSLQAIEQPEIVKEGINQIINSSTGAMRWVHDYLSEFEAEKDNTCGIIQMSSLIDLMRDMNQSKNNEFWRPMGTKARDIERIATILQDYFENAIYRLKDEFITGPKMNKINMTKKQGAYEFINNTYPTNKLNDEDSLTKYNEYRRKYLEENVATNKNVTRCGYKDMFIVGYVYHDINKLQAHVEEEL